MAATAFHIGRSLWGFHDQSLTGAAKNSPVGSNCRIIEYHSTSLSIGLRGKGARALRLNRSSYVATDLASQMHQLAGVLTTLSEDYVVWLPAVRMSPPLLQEIRDLAAKRGVETLAVTDVGGAHIDPAPDHQILVSRGDPGEPQLLVVPMTIANAVILDLCIDR